MDEEKDDLLISVLITVAIIGIIAALLGSAMGCIKIEPAEHVIGSNVNCWKRDIPVASVEVTVQGELPFGIEDVPDPFYLCTGPHRPCIRCTATPTTTQMMQ